MRPLASISNENPPACTAIANPFPVTVVMLPVAGNNCEWFGEQILPTGGTAVAFLHFESLFNGPIPRWVARLIPGSFGADYTGYKYTGMTPAGLYPIEGPCFNFQSLIIDGPFPLI